MIYKLKILGLAILLAGAALLPLAKADEWNKETTLTFSASVQIPGQVLQAAMSSSSLIINQTITSCRSSTRIRPGSSQPFWPFPHIASNQQTTLSSVLRSDRRAAPRLSAGGSNRAIWMVLRLCIQRISDSRLNSYCRPSHLHEVVSIKRLPQQGRLNSRISLSFPFGPEFGSSLSPVCRGSLCPRRAACQKRHLSSLSFMQPLAQSCAGSFKGLA